MGFVDVVDQDDQVIGEIDGSLAQQAKGIIYRTVHVLVRDSKNRLLLQRRSANRIARPLHWTSSASGAVDKGETYLEAALRETQEEIGLKVSAPEMVLVKKMRIITDEDEMVSIYEVRSEGPFKPNHDEVDELRFFSKEEIKSMIKRKEKLSATFIKVFEECFA